MDRNLRAPVVTQGPFGQSANLADEDLSSGVSWAAVIGGSSIIAALSWIMLALGSGLGFASVSPWSGSGVSATTFTIGVALWLILLQLIPSALGGYLAGRLRTKWARVHTDETFFRDTAHGFMSWAVAVVVTATFVAAATAIVAGGAAIGGAAAAASNPNDYYVDTMFRAGRVSETPLDEMTRGEITRAFASAMTTTQSSAVDRQYLARTVAARTGISEAEAQQQVDSAIAQSNQALDTARKAAAQMSMWTFIALLIGAFSASYAATIGGRQRDNVPAL